MLKWCLLFCLAAFVGCDRAKQTPHIRQTSSAPELVATADKLDDGLIPDDGTTSWAAPTAGRPLDASMLSDGTGLAFWIRPSDLLKLEEGQRILDALGPVTTALQEAAEVPLQEIDRLVLWASAGESYQAAKVSIETNPQTLDRLPLLERSLEQLIESSDQDRHFSLFFSPRFLLGDGGNLLTNHLEPLRDLLLAGSLDKWAAVAVSLHIDETEQLYWEVRIIGQAGAPELSIARTLRRQFEQWPADQEELIHSQNWAEYSREAIQRSSGMLNVVAKFARLTVEGRQALVNGYAPAGAAHQLALVGQRLVAEIAAPVVGSTTGASPVDSSLASIEQRLAKLVSISFRSESLTTALTILSDELEIPITVNGRDLQLDGITRNQMLSLSVSDLAGAATLIEVLRRANPDKEAKSPADPRQKLVYVIRDQGIVVTTRKATQSRGEQLPKVFQVKNSPR